jgi:hypothetical protein
MNFYVEQFVPLAQPALRQRVLAGRDRNGQPRRDTRDSSASAVAKKLRFAWS